MRSPFGRASSEGLQKRLREHVEQLAGVIGPRHLGRGNSLETAAAYVERELSALGSVERQPYAIDGKQAANIVLERVGDSQPGSIVILGAHYDTVPETPGADDNASAVAVLLEAAALLKEVRLQKTVRFVGFPCEEPPHFYTGSMGSQVYAVQCRKRGEQIVGMLCLEMVGYFSSEPGSQQVPEELARFLRGLMPRKGDFLAAVGNLQSQRLCQEFRQGFTSAVSLPLLAVALPESVDAIRLSDNSSFWDEGYPALMITDTSFLRNPNYHEPSDTPETLDYTSMAQVTLGVAGAILQIAGSSC